MIGGETELLLELLIDTASCVTRYVFSGRRYMYKVEGAITEAGVIASVYLDK